MEFALLRELGGYNRETLGHEPAGVVRRWIEILQAEAAEQRRQNQGNNLKWRSRRR